MAKEKIVKDNAERWLLTYADLMNLLLILFIILFAMSQVDTQKFQQLSQSLSAAFGSGSNSVLQGSGQGNSLIDFPATMPSPVIPAEMEDKQIDGIAQEVREIIKGQGLEGSIDVKRQERGVVISINERLFFKSGSAVIEKESEEKVLKIGNDILAKIPNKHIRIEGHTDNVPIKSAIFPSNWELSSARATSVLRILVDKSKIDPRLISAVGYGEFTPLVPNDSDANREKNRRVDIVILTQDSSQGEASTDNNNIQGNK
ncbi:motility protein B [Ruminiclostridium hungatei]|uniref:Motility protein B n=1 Tax=Ruminiclostridium hungatei TaxID=48256 RepID=A0A1V4SLV9_RUMHU|nr:flagellar motor protein MotB [Ruminiclostridium hungatei]OPX44858.1 motility protein B [Ruminiclostridium hungatei]